MNEMCPVAQFRPEIIQKTRGRKILTILSQKLTKSHDGCPSFTKKSPCYWISPPKGAGIRAMFQKGPGANGGFDNRQYNV